MDREEEESSNQEYNSRKLRCGITPGCQIVGECRKAVGQGEIEAAIVKEADTLIVTPGIADRSLIMNQEAAKVFAKELHDDITNLSLVSPPSESEIDGVIARAKSVLNQAQDTMVLLNAADTAVQAGPIKSA